MFFRFFERISVIDGRKIKKLLIFAVMFIGDVLVLTASDIGR